MNTTLLKSEKALISERRTSKTALIYWTSTLSLCALMIAAVIYMLGENEAAKATFLALGYPDSLVYPLAFAKIAGIIAIITYKSKLLSEWAYAGFFFVSIFALAAHVCSNVGHFAPSLLAVTLIIISYVTSKKLKSVS